MDLVLQEKKIIAGNHEEDTKKILFKMLRHLREIKSLKKKLDNIGQQKQANDEKLLQLISIFRGRQQEIEVLNGMLQLVQMRRYSNDIDQIDPELNSNDEIMLQGYELIKQLKKQVQKVKQIPNFEKQAGPQETTSLGGTSSSKS
jgi:hypothetical protein